MAIYSYYSIFEPINEENYKGYAVSFPDLENVFTDGRSFAEAYEMAKDVLGTMLALNEEENTAFHPPSAPDKLTIREGSSLIYIQIDTDDYREAE
ncbi:type II toxin-antitoxin system HicB family antitoxin [Caldibacillus lycopersici]|uniref:Type II toxin-antitoxin system HicB family antitoxin n=1 Tax=Perspicuibacillus lycopersici TaxID=1325689 RepID=A0AAE3IVF4_9BACI|nr:type II toxin-antitoxin system HicB family antitoxin [Perspicuibacillus lycopersici]MCU9614942.1 type II toxin-antitoxin system HicB family antitoxin [Perspicuibacillus lycopersici]